MMFQVFLSSVGDVRLSSDRTGRIPTAESSGGAILQSPPVAAFVGAFLGCLATLYLSTIGIAPAIASALATTLLCGEALLIQTPCLLPGEFFTAIYGGAFGGMTPVLWLSGNVDDPSLVQVVALFISLSVFCGCAFLIVAVIDAHSDRPPAFGCGGRSGAIAAVACLVFLQLAPLFGADDRLFRAAAALDANTTFVAQPWVACLIGTFVTLFALRRQGFESATTADRTFVAAAVALIGLIILHVNDLGDARTSDAFYAGSFLGMSTPDRLRGRIAPVLGSIALVLLLVHFRTLLPGIGGSLGLAAFVTVAALVAMGRMITFMTGAISSRNEQAETTTWWPASGHLSWLRVPAGARAWLEPRGFAAVSVLGRPARAMASATLASVAIACIVLPGQLAPEKLALDTALSTKLSQVSQAISAQLDLVQARVKTADDAIEVGSPAVDVDSVEVRTAQDQQTKLKTGDSALQIGFLAVDVDSVEVRTTQDQEAELKTVDSANQIGSPSLDVDGVGARTTQDRWPAEEPADGQAEHVQRTAQATPATADVTKPQVSEPAPSGASADVTEAKEKIFLEFEQWRAARLAGIAGAAHALPKVRSRERQADRATSRSGTEPISSWLSRIHTRRSASSDRGNQLPR
jgi:hypothetical protein